MCQIVSHKFEVLAGTPPRRYVLTTRVGDHPEILVENALAQELIRWDRKWGRFHPTSETTLTRAISEFDRRFALRHPQRLDQVNAELATAALKKFTAKHGGDRQLPAGDRA